MDSNIQRVLDEYHAWMKRELAIVRALTRPTSGGRCALRAFN